MSPNDFVTCPYCGKKLNYIPSHLKIHNKTTNDMKDEFPTLPFMSHKMKKIVLKGAHKNKKSINYIKSYLNTNNINYDILSKKYKNSRDKLKWKCDNSHIFFMSWTEFQQGHRCFECFGSKKKTNEEINNMVFSSGYKWVSGKYKHIYSKLKLKCDRGHIYIVRYDQFQAGHRCPLCHHEDNIIKFSGSGNPNWRGGLSYEPYCEIWTNELKEYIKYRDKNICLNPCCKSSNPSNLVIHHIDYNKKNCDQYNLITLCNTCNTEANFNRQWHMYWYKAIIYMRYKAIKGEMIE
jgi:hypothetical protein